MPTGIAIDGPAKGKELAAMTYRIMVPHLEGYYPDGPLFSFVEYIWNGAAWTADTQKVH